MTRSFIRDTLLPLLVFPALSYFAVKQTMGNLFVSGLSQKIDAHCPPLGSGSTPYTLAYTGRPRLDHGLCGLVAFFHEAMTPGDPLTFLAYFIGVGSIFAVVPAIEGYRTNRSIFIGLPVIFGLVSQVLTIGGTTPIYWLIFFLSGGRAKFEKTQPISQAHAEAVIFGLFAGAAIPSICMLVLDDPIVTAIWQPYPIFVSLASLLHLQFRRPNYRKLGYKTIQRLYVATFIVSSSIHIAILWPRLHDLSVIRAFFIPSVAPLVGQDTPAQVTDFLKWDFTFGFLSMGIAQLWFVSDLVEIPFIILWYIVATPVVGPASAVVAALLWREGQIGDRVAPIKEKET